VVTGLAGIDSAADRLDNARRLHADGRGIGGKRVSAGAMLDVDVVQPDRGLPEQDFARRGRCDIVPLVAQHGRRPGLRHDDAIGAHAAGS
jgi:hypothetical protein